MTLAVRVPPGTPAPESAPLRVIVQTVLAVLSKVGVLPKEIGLATAKVLLVSKVVPAAMVTGPVPRGPLPIEPVVGVLLAPRTIPPVLTFRPPLKVL